MEQAATDHPISVSLKRLTYLVGLPVGAVVVGATWLLLFNAGDLRPLDAVLLPAVGLLALLLAGLFAFTPLSRRLLDVALYLGAGGYLLISTGLHLFGAGDVMLFTKAGLWLPTFSALIYLLFGPPLGRWLASLPAAVLLLLWAIGSVDNPDIPLLTVVLQVAVASGLTVLLLDVATRSSLAKSRPPAVPEDPLTGLPGRTTTLQRLEQEMSRAQARLSLILLEIDGLGDLRESHGPESGNAALGALAGFVAEGVREAELVGRWDQETLLIAVARTEAASAAMLAERLRRGVMRRPFDGLPRLTVSVGVAVRLPGESAMSLLERAERALGSARQGGGDQVWTPAKRSPDQRGRAGQGCGTSSSGWPVSSAAVGNPRASHMARKRPPGRRISWFQLPCSITRPPSMK